MGKTVAELHAVMPSATSCCNSNRQDDKRQRNQARDRLYTYDEDYWNNAFDDTFTEPGTGMGTLDKINQFTNNSFLNLKL